MRLHQPIQKAITSLKQEQSEIEQRLTQLQSTIDRLNALSKGGDKTAQSSGRQLSSAGREAISRAAKKRWAQYRRAKARQPESHV
jgi:prefoldin subunit 5